MITQLKFENQNFKALFLNESILESYGQIDALQNELDEKNLIIENLKNQKPSNISQNVTYSLHFIPIVFTCLNFICLSK